MPPDPRLELARGWLERARADLAMARLGLQDGSLSGLAAFHCQQAAEKALKAFLAWRNQPLPRTHDLPELLFRCQPLDATFAELQTATTVLDTYLTVGRYPDTGPEPTPDEAAQALPHAEQVVDFVAIRLPAITT
jgi:HEPN domain-containing protein